MDQETQERLMIDDALGALEPDVQELLAAYLSATGAGEKARHQWRDLAAAARKAMPPDVQEALPPFPSRQIHIRSVWRLTQTAAAAAALIVIGFGLGHLRFEQPEKSVMVAQSAAAQPAASFGVRDFWSTQRVLAAVMEIPHQDRPAWRWNFSTQKPETGGQP